MRLFVLPYPPPSSGIPILNFLSGGKGGGLVEGGGKGGQKKKKRERHGVRGHLLGKEGALESIPVEQYRERTSGESVAGDSLESLFYNPSGKIPESTTLWISYKKRTYKNEDHFPFCSFFFFFS